MTINQHNTYVFCPQLIKYVRRRRRIDSSSIIAHPVNYDIHWESSLKCYGKNWTYVTILIIDMDFLYQLNLGLTAPLFTVSFREIFEKKLVFKIFKSW